MVTNVYHISPLDLAKLNKNQDFQRAIEGAFVALERFEAAGDPDAQVETWRVSDVENAGNPILKHGPTHWVDTN